MFTMPDSDHRARINLSFDLSDPGESAVYKVLLPLAKKRKATAYITALVLKKMNEDAEKALGIEPTAPVPDTKQDTKMPRPAAAAQSTEESAKSASDDDFNAEFAMDIMDVFGG